MYDVKLIILGTFCQQNNIDVFNYQNSKLSINQLKINTS